jgi:hypothetical protein
VATAAQMAGQQHRAQDCGSGNQVENRAGEQYDIDADDG